ncbi:MAG: hypothetical protein R3D60_13740, partial [Paracoccaceae bacterium]
GAVDGIGARRPVDDAVGVVTRIGWVEDRHEYSPSATRAGQIGSGQSPGRKQQALRRRDHALEIGGTKSVCGQSPTSLRFTRNTLAASRLRITPMTRHRRAARKPLYQMKNFPQTGFFPFPIQSEEFVTLCPFIVSTMETAAPGKRQIWGQVPPLLRHISDSAPLGCVNCPGKRSDPDRQIRRNPDLTKPVLSPICAQSAPNRPGITASGNESLRTRRKRIARHV